MAVSRDQWYFVPDANIALRDAVHMVHAAGWEMSQVDGNIYLHANPKFPRAQINMFVSGMREGQLAAVLIQFLADIARNPLSWNGDFDYRPTKFPDIPGWVPDIPGWEPQPW